ncbi:MAG: hypothetical protein RIQ93_3239 [Verrucomicrobiota bacterium]|jgi:hypothetical protein
MPPVGRQAEPLTAAQIELLRRWMGEGANREEHWSFKPPVKAALAAAWTAVAQTLANLDETITRR